LQSSSVSAGISLSYNLFDWGSSDAAASSAAKRANAARRQYDEFMKIRSARVGELLDVAGSSFERAKRYIDVLKDSERVRSATFQQWSQLGRRSLFDVMASEGDHFALRVAYINALYDGYEANSQLRSLGGGLAGWTGVRPSTP
jgi:adhesin transport system outer membrane protein